MTGEDRLSKKFPTLSLPHSGIVSRYVLATGSKRISSTASLKLNIPSSANCLGFDFAFYSEEFEEFVGSNFNDTFTAEIGGTDITINGSEVIAPLNFAFGAVGEIISVNTAFGVVSFSSL